MAKIQVELSLISIETILTQKEVDLLGMPLDIKFDFATYISKLCKKAASKLNFIKRLKRHFDIESK